MMKRKVMSGIYQKMSKNKKGHLISIDTPSVFRTVRQSEGVSALSGHVWPRHRTSRPRWPLSRAYPLQATVRAVFLSGHDSGKRGRQRGNSLI